MRFQTAAPVILLVDDHDDSREMYDLGLRRAGYDVIACADGAEALGRKPSGPIDVVVLDYSMPRMSGADLAVRLKEQEATQASRYVLVTGHGPDALRNAAKAVHFDAMVKKPVAPDQLARVVRTLLRERAASAVWSDVLERP